MRRLLVIAALFSLLLAVPTASPHSGAAQKARLTLADLDPVVVRGYGFRRLERVKLTLFADGSSRTRWVRAGLTGRFVARFDTVRVDRCSQGVGVNAAGAKGSSAAIAAKRPAPDCPPELGP